MLTVFDAKNTDFIEFDYSSMTMRVNSSVAEPKNYTCKLELIEYENKRQLSRISSGLVPFIFIIQILDKDKYVEPRFFIHQVNSYGVAEVRFS